VDVDLLEMFLCSSGHRIIFNRPVIDDLSCHDETASVENSCAPPVKLAENHRKTRGKFLVNRGMMRVRLAENQGQMRRKFARNRGMMRVKLVEKCKKIRGVSIQNLGMVRPVLFWRMFPFSLCKMIIFFVRMFKRSPTCCLKRFEG
jgi:hypothetical protein